MSPLFVLPYDRWESYLAEREELLQFMRANLRNVIFLTTDLHGTLILEVTPFLSIDPVAKEVIVGPIASSGALAKTGMAPPAVRAPRASLGAPACVHLDTFSYGLVEVDRQAQPPLLTITLKGQDGQPLLDPLTQQPCRITIEAEDKGADAGRAASAKERTCTTMEAATRAEAAAPVGGQARLIHPRGAPGLSAGRRSHPCGWSVEAWGRCPGPCRTGHAG